LGRISVEFQRLESRLASGIAFLLDPDDAYLGAIVTAQLSFRVLIDLFAAPYHHRFDDPLKDKELGKLLGRCAEAENRRNQIIHSEWTPDYKTGKDAVRTKYTARKELRKQEEYLSEADLRKIADDLSALHKEFARSWLVRLRSSKFVKRDPDLMA
jgi:hypothetical protein